MNVIEAGRLAVERNGSGEGPGLRVMDSGVELAVSTRAGGASGYTFAYVEAEGDFDIEARLHEVPAGAEAGLVIRSGAGPLVPAVAVLVSPDGRARLQRRDELGGGIHVVGEPYHAFTFPVYLKVERRGPSYKGWYSHDGLQWTDFAWTDVEDMPRGLRAGLAVSGGGAGRAVFSSMTLNELPSG